jgi:23S rRNA (guanosine2251-2'-O)-methyltransferase
MREWVVGRNPVFEVLRANRRHVFRLTLAQGTQEKGRVSEIIQICEERRVPLEHTPRNLLDTLGYGHQGVALEVSSYSYSHLQDILRYVKSQSEPALLLLLDTLQDPQNLGTILRTAECVGVHGVLLPLRHTVTVTPAVVSASSGACEHLLIAQVNLAQAIVSLKNDGLWVVGLESRLPGKPLENKLLGGPLALVVGSEGKGLRPLIRDSCDFLMRLPMRGRIDSLNAATAGSVALYLIWQVRGFE